MNEQEAINIRREELTVLAKKHFPFPNPNPGQLETCVEAIRLFESGIKHVVVQAPTGIGKSVIATTVHRMLRELRPAHRTTIITATKGLQDQYTEDDKLIFDLKGKTNYSCPINRGPYNSGSCRSAVKQGRCVKNIVCPYVVTRRKWMDIAQLRSTNNSFQIEACPSICMDEKNRCNLIIADECHDLDDHIIQHTTLKFKVSDYIELGEYGITTVTKAITDLVKTFQSRHVGVPFKLTMDQYNAMQELSDAVTKALGALEDMFEDESRNDHDHIGSCIEMLQQINDKAAIFEDINDGDICSTEWVLHEFEIDELVTLKSVYAKQVSNYALFRKADIFLHMSATICGFESYAETLGLNPDEWAYFDLENPIPVANRKVYALQLHKMNSSFSEFDALAKDIDKLITLHKDVNGIIHTVSFKLAQDIYSRSKYKDRMLVSGDRNEIMAWLSGKQGRVVLSPSIEKGYDFKNDLSRFQIIAKVPFLYLGDPFVKMNVNMNQSWYSRKAILRIVQSCGRSIRGVNDYAKTYILDSNFKRLFEENANLFPTWFINSVVMR